MRVLSSFRDAKTRLQALVAFITIPVVLIMILLAVTADRSLSSRIDRDWRRYTDDYAIRAQLWLVGTARTLMATAVSLTGLAGDENRCGEAIRNVVAATSAYLAIRVDFRDRSSCVAARDANYVSLVDELS